MHFINAPSKLLEALNPFAPFKRISPPSNSHLLFFSSSLLLISFILFQPLQTPPSLKKNINPRRFKVPVPSHPLSSPSSAAHSLLAPRPQRSLLPASSHPPNDSILPTRYDHLVYPLFRPSPIILFLFPAILPSSNLSLTSRPR